MAMGQFINLTNEVEGLFWIKMDTVFTIDDNTLTIEPS